MLPILPLSLPYTSLESGRVGVERAVEAQETAAQKATEALPIEPSSPSVPRTRLESSMIDVDVSRYLALASARVIQASESLSEEAVGLGEPSD